MSVAVRHHFAVLRVLVVLLTLAALTSTSLPKMAGALTQTVSASVSGDTQVRSASPNTNYGGVTTITVDGNEPAGTGSDTAALIRFNLPTLPAGATITDAKLRLNVTNSTTNTYSVFVMKKAWVENQATWNRYKTGSTWERAGGRGATDRESPAIASITPNATGVQDFDLGVAFDQQVDDWMRGVEANNGIELINIDAPDGFDFFTREVATASQKPQLIITYGDGVAADTTPPETTITSGSAEGETLTVDSATFGFSSSEANSTFECSLDGATYSSCTSPQQYTGLADGSHTFSVRAIDAAGNVDDTPATRNFSVSVTPPPPSKSLDLFEPPDGYLYAGVDADQHAGDTVAISTQKWQNFVALMNGIPPAISHTFTGYDANFTFDTDIAKARGATPLISWQSGDTSPKTIANAGLASTGRPSDEIILRNAYILRTYGKPVFVRIDHEMNAYWFKWCAYNQDGTARAHTTEDYKDMWRRIVIIFDGGKVSEINARLAAEGMPPLDPNVTMPSYMSLPSTSNPDSYFPPTNNVAFVFNPVDAPGIPNKVGNRWADYYPGDEYVDWVGQTSYDTTWNASLDTRFGWLSSFYTDFAIGHDKPYMMAEWGLTTSRGDDPAYVQRMLDWQKAHPKVKALVYFNVQTSSTDHRLESYPNSRAVLAADAPRYLKAVSAP